jgi:hypothetical protein
LFVVFFGGRGRALSVERNAIGFMMAVVECFGRGIRETQAGDGGC